MPGGRQVNAGIGALGRPMCGKSVGTCSVMGSANARSDISPRSCRCRRHEGNYVSPKSHFENMRASPDPTLMRLATARISWAGCSSWRRVSIWSSCSTRWRFRCRSGRRGIGSVSGWNPAYGQLSKLSHARRGTYCPKYSTSAATATFRTSRAIKA